MNPALKGEAAPAGGSTLAGRSRVEVVLLTEPAFQPAQTSAAQDSEEAPPQAQPLFSARLALLQAMCREFAERGGSGSESRGNGSEASSSSSAACLARLHLAVAQLAGVSDYQRRCIMEALRGGK